MNMTNHNRQHPTGFTLIELLVSIGIIGVLLGLMLPALAGARGSAMQTVALSNVRSVGTQFTQFANENGKYPHQGLGEVPDGLFTGGEYEPRGDELIIEWYPGGMVIATTDYFSHSWMWPAMVADIDEWPTYWETWISPRKGEELPELHEFGFDPENSIEDVISIKYSNSFVTRPAYWDGQNHGNDLSMFKSTRPHDVQYASGKVMLWDDDLSYMVGKNEPERIDGLLEAKTPMMFADGHADALVPSDASDGVMNSMTGETVKLHGTKDGVAGRDY